VSWFATVTKGGIYYKDGEAYIIDWATCDGVFYFGGVIRGAHSLDIFFSL
jgi:hypothetical protein